MKQSNPYRLVIHGGAGTIRKANLSADRESAIHHGLREALAAGHSILQDKGTSLQAVVAAVTVMEDNELFNAGKGAVYDACGGHSLEASLMDGNTLKAGALAHLKHIRNPIQGASIVLTHSDFVFLAGTEAEAFCQSNGLQLVDSNYFDTEWRYKALLKAQSKASIDEMDESDRHGTVGAVALDWHGNVAAATSTGGMTNKKYGRIGDTPIIGAATWAENSTCAVSTTGHGEYFIRLAMAKEVAAAMEYANMTLEKATQHAIQKLSDLGGSGGLIAVNQSGDVSLAFNSEGMYRGYLENDEMKTLIYT